MAKSLRSLMLVAVLALVATGCPNNDDGGAEGADSGDEQSLSMGANEGDETEGGSDQPVVLVAVARDTAAVESGRYSLTIEVEGDVDADIAEQVGPMTADIEFSGDDMSFTMDLSAVAAFDDEITEMFGDDLVMDVVVSDGEMYMRGFFAALFGGDPEGWISLPGDSAEVTPADPDSVTADQWLGVLEAAGIGAEVVGEEDVDGVGTTHYRVDTTLRELVESDPKSAEPFKLDGAEATDVEVEVWVGNDGLARRIIFRADYPGAGDDAEPFTVVTTIEMTDLNEDIEIQVPSEDEVTVLTEEEILGAIFGGLAGADTEGLAGLGSDLEDAFGDLEGGLEDAFGDLEGSLEGSVGEDGANAYGDDAELDALWDACEGGDGKACDDLYYQSPFGSEYEEFGNTCGGRGYQFSCAADS